MSKSSTPQEVRRKLSRIYFDSLRTRDELQRSDTPLDTALFESMADSISAASQLTAATRLERAGAIGSCLRTIGTGLATNQAELDEHDFQKYFDVVTAHTASPNVEIAACAVWALGDVGIPPEQTREKLIELIHEEARTEPGKTGTCRGVAFRMLAKVDKEAAMQLKHTPACLEFIKQLSDYRDQRLAKDPSLHSPKVDAELDPWIESQ